MATFDLKFSEERLTLLGICQNLAELDVECCLAGIHKTDPQMVSSTLQKTKHPLKKRRQYYRKRDQPKSVVKISSKSEQKQSNPARKRNEEKIASTPKKRVVHHHHHHHHQPPAHLNTPSKYPGRKKVEDVIPKKNQNRRKNVKKKRKRPNFNTRSTALERDMTFTEIKSGKRRQRSPIRKRILKSDPNRLFRRKYMKIRIQHQNRRRRERERIEQSFSPDQNENHEVANDHSPRRKERGWDWERKMQVFKQLKQKLLEEKQVQEHFRNYQIPPPPEKQEPDETSPSTSNRMIPMADIVEDDKSKPEESSQEENIEQQPDDEVGSVERESIAEELPEYEGHIDDNEPEEDGSDEKVFIRTPIQELSIAEKKERIDHELEEFLRKRVVDKDGMYQTLLRLEDERNEIRGRFEELRDVDFSSLRSSLNTDIGDEEEEEGEMDDGDEDMELIGIDDGVVLEEEEKKIILEKKEKFLDYIRKNTSNMEIGKSSEIIEIVGEKILDEILEEVASETFEKSKGM